MSALTCDFCGRISIHMDGWRQLFSRSMASHDDEVSYMVCPKCHKKIVEENVGAIVDPEVQIDAVRESYEDSDPTKDYIGMQLRDFLCSGMYLKTQNIYFLDRLEMPIKDYMPVMDAIVIEIEKPDQDGKIFVKLDTEI